MFIYLFKYDPSFNNMELLCQEITIRKEESTVKIVQKSAVNEGDYTVLTFKTSLFTHQCQAFHLVKSHMGKAQGGQI